MHVPDGIQQAPDTSNTSSRYVTCFRKLHQIVWILRCDAHGQQIHLLRQVIQEHHRLWADLYPESSKPKLHHLLHIPDAIDYLGKVIACFTCERKHREVKRTAVNVFRHFEHTTITDMLHSLSEDLSEHDLFAEQTLIRCEHHVVVEQKEMLTAASCLCHCGEISANDIVVFESGSVGKVISFWKHGDNESIAVQFILMKKLHDSTDVYVQGDVMFSPVSQIIDAVVWFPMSEGRIRVGMPPGCVLAD